MTRIYLVRHGEVEGNSGDHRTFAGWADKPLTERGQAQAAAIAARLSRENIGFVASSDLQRARITAKGIAAQHGLTVDIDRDLREVSYGAWESLSEDEINAAYPEAWKLRVADPERNAPTGGESLGDLWRRLEPAFGRVVANTDATPQRTGVLVAHNGPIRVLLCSLLGVPLNHFRRVHSNNCGLSWVERKDASSVWTAMCINDTSHLQGLS